MDCWEFKNCGSDVRDKCPAYPENGLDCWKVTGTMCGQGRYKMATLKEEIEFCRTCDCYLEHAHKF